jgi:threonylcarbamoyladenosine tRNA methylthiotransferase MtaB
MMNNLFTHTLGCKVNFADMQAVVERLQLEGIPKTAIVGTCCVTAEGEKQSRKEVRRAASRVGPAGSVFVTGCAARLSPDVFAGLAENVFVVAGEPDEVAAGIQTRLARVMPGEATVAAMNPAAATTGVGLGKSNSYDSGRTRFFLKIQDGCSNRCSYCVIPRVRGKPRSIPAAAVLATAVQMVAAGYPELVVSGINAGAWCDGGMGLASLLDRLAGIGGLARLRLSSVDVSGVTPDLLEVMARHPIIGRHLHIPLQSGDDSVLEAMGRRYDTAVFTEAVRRARVQLPGVNITTDVIVGFPSEDTAAFTNTLRFIESAGFTRIHVFSYSSRPGIAAAGLGDPVPAIEKGRRSRLLRSLSERLQQAHRQRKVGLTSEILLESPLAQGVHGGYSSDYTRFVVRGGRPGAIVQVRGAQATREGVRGEVIEA